MTTELLTIRPEDEPRVDAAWETVRDLHDVLLARVDALRALTLNYIIVGIGETTAEIPVQAMVMHMPSVVRRRSRQDLTDMLTEYEDRFGFSTAELPEKVQSGELDESLDVRRWLSLRSIHQRLKP